MIIIIDLDYKVNSIKVINWKSRQYQTPGRASRLLMTFLYLMLTYLEISGQQYTRTELSVFNGLGQGDVFSISQDSLGYIWMATAWRPASISATLSLFGQNQLTAWVMRLFIKMQK